MVRWLGEVLKNSLKSGLRFDLIVNVLVWHRDKMHQSSSAGLWACFCLKETDQTLPFDCGHWVVMLCNFMTVCRDQTCSKTLIISLRVRASAGVSSPPWWEMIGISITNCCGSMKGAGGKEWVMALGCLTGDSLVGLIVAASRMTAGCRSHLIMCCFFSSCSLIHSGHNHSSLCLCLSTRLSFFPFLLVLILPSSSCLHLFSPRFVNV